MEELLRALHEALDGLEEDDLQIGDITKGDDGKKDSRGKAAKKAISKAMQHIAGLYKKLKLKASDIPRTDSEILEDAMKALLGMIGELLEEGHLRKANDMIDNLRRVVARCVKDEGKQSTLLDLLDRLQGGKEQLEKKKLNTGMSILDLIRQVRFTAKQEATLEEGRNIRLDDVKRRIDHWLSEIHDAIAEDGDLYQADILIELLRRDIEKNIADPEKTKMLEFLAQMLRQKYGGYLLFSARSLRSYFAEPSSLLDSAYAGVPLQEIPDLPLHAVRGIS